MNSVNLVGRVTNDIELRKSSGGKSYVFFTLAVNSFRNGEQQATFIPCVAWNLSAENMAKYVKKGQMLSVEGSLSVASQKGQNGEYITRVNVVVGRVNFLSRPSDSGQISNEQFNNSNNVSEQTSNNLSSNEQDEPYDDAILWDY